MHSSTHVIITPIVIMPDVDPGSAQLLCWLMALLLTRLLLL
jgi:hypothetical protein